MTRPDSVRSRRCDHAHPGRLRLLEAPDSRGCAHRRGHHGCPHPVRNSHLGSDCPGLPPRRDPPIPLFSIPAIDVFASNADKAVVQAASTSLASVPGVTVSPAKCDGTGSANAAEVKSASKASFTGSNNAVQYEDGNAPQVGSDSGANNVVSKDN